MNTTVGLYKKVRSPSFVQVKSKDDLLRKVHKYWTLLTTTVISTFGDGNKSVRERPLPTTVPTAPVDGTDRYRIRERSVH